MRRLSTWLLILALVLLALCLLWLLPRLLREEPRPEQNLASVAASPNPGREPTSPDAPEASTSSESSPSTVSTPEPSPARATAESPEDPRAAETGTSRSALRGRVVDRAGKSLPGVLVFAAHAPDAGTPIAADEAWIAHLPIDVADPKSLGAETPASAITDSLGLFRFEDLEPGRVRLAVRSPRHAPLDRNDLRVGSGTDAAIGDLVLDAASWVDGSLLDGADRPVRKAKLVGSEPFFGSSLPPLAPDRGVRPAETEVRGRFRAGPLAAGPYRLHALGGAEFESAVIDVPDAAEAGEYTVTLPEAATITGTVFVRGGRSGELAVRALPAETARVPVPFQVRADARTAGVARDGSFRLEGLSAGVTYELRAGSALARFEDAGPWNPPAFATAGDAGVRLSWSADASVTFELADAGGSPIRGTCRVTFERAIPAVALVLAEGERSSAAHEISGLRPTGVRKVDLVVACRGFESVPRTVELAPGGTSDLGTVAMKPSSRLSVHVVDAATDRAVAGARVRASEISTGLDASGFEPEPAATDAKGDASVPSWFGAGSRVEVVARGYAPVSLAGPFGYGYSVPKLEVRLLRGATARIRVLSDDGAPIPGARVEWIRGDWTPPSSRDAAARPRPIAERPDPRTSRVTDAEGRAVFANLAPGRHAFRVERHRSTLLDGEWTQRELRDGEDLEIDLESRAPASLEVRVTDGGAPLAGAPVCFLRAEDGVLLSDPGELATPLPQGLDARLDARGRVLFQDVDAPAVDLLAVFVAGQQRRACFPVPTRAGGGTFAVDLSTSSVAGIVLDAARAPQAGVEILYADEARERELFTRSRRKTLLDAPADLSALGIEQPATTTDAEGRFRLVGLPLERPFTLVARALPGEGGACAAGRSDSIVLHRGDVPLGVEIALVPAGTVAIRSRMLPDPAPCTLLASSRASAKTPGSLPRVRRVYPGRTEVLYGLAPGEWDLEITSDDRRLRDRLHVDVSAAEFREVELKLP